MNFYWEMAQRQIIITGALALRAANFGFWAMRANIEAARRLLK